MDAKKKKAIIVEKNHVFRDYLRSVISRAGVLSYCFQTENAGLDNISGLKPDLIVLGLLPRERVLQFLNALKAIECELPVVVISEDSAVRAYADIHGLANIIILDSYARLKEFKKIIQAAADQKPKHRARQKIPFIVGNHPEILKIKRALPQLSRSGDSILIKGEKGVGKETLARAIHLNSSDKKELFIKINAAALSAEKTSWRWVDFFAAHALNGKGKPRRRKNHVSGTLYVDEICDIPDALQAELLLVETQTGRPALNPELNGINSFRIIAGAAKNIDSLLKRNKFRKDLYYRMNVFDLNIPPLRDRKDDIPLLTDFLTYKLCRIYNKSYFELSKDVKRTFLDYHWPGNVRELENAVKSAVMVRDEKNFLSSFYRKNGIQDTANSHQGLGGGMPIDELIDPKDYVEKIDKMSLKAICWDCLAHLEKKLMKKALDKTNWNRKKAADMLRISYKSMLNKIKAYDLA